MKKTISLILCFAMILSTVAFSFPAIAVEMDFGVEASEDLAQTTEKTDEVVLAGTLGNGEGKPGINILTGTEDIYDFEDENYEHAILVTRTEGIIADPDDADNRVMWIGGVQFSNIGLTPIPKSVDVNSAANQDASAGVKYPLLAGKSFEPDRPFTMTFKLKGDAASDKGLQFMSGIGNAKVNGGTGWKQIGGFYVRDGMNWTEEAIEFTYAQATSSMQTFMLCFLNSSNITGNFYIDDISIVPDYLVRYYDIDGTTVVASEYVDYRNETYAISAAIASQFASKDKFLGFKFVGDDDTELIEGNITLANEDLKIMPVFDTNLIAADYMSATEGATLTITSKVPVTEWTIDDDFEVSIKGYEDSAVLTAKGYSGVVTVTATGEGWSESIKVYTKGGNKIRPGVNLGTGTTDPITFEKAWESYSLGRDTSIVNGSDALVDNGNDKVVALKANVNASGQNYPQIFFSSFDYTALESDRPLKLEFDYVGKFANLWPLDFSGKSASLGGVNSQTAWKHFSKTFKKTATTSNNGFQWGKLYTDAAFIDNLSLTPYYKVTYTDATGVELGYVYAEPNVEFTVSDSMVAMLDTERYAGFKVKGTDKLVTSFVPYGDTDMILVPATKEGVEVIEPVSVTGHDGKTTDVDPKYPGVYYVFDEPLDVDTITPEEIANVWGDSFTYDEETNTLVVFSQTKKVVGHEEYFQGYDSNIMTESGKLVVLPKSPVISYASTVANDGKNMIPYGDFETAYNPFYEIGDAGNVVISVETDGDNSYLVAEANTTEATFPHVAFQTVLVAGATYRVYAETKAIDSDTAMPQVNIIFAGDTEGGVVNHASVDSYHVFNGDVATEEKGEDGTWTYAAEFTVSAIDGGAETAVAQVAIYSSPEDSATVGFTVDNFELYRESNVVYKPTIGINAEGIEPYVDSVFINGKGGIPSEEAVVTVISTDYYPTTGVNRVIDGWVSTTDGITYNEGDAIDLTTVELDENGDYVLIPNVKPAEGYDYVTVSFDSTNVAGAPEAVEGYYLAGDTVEMAEYYEGVASTVNGQRFNGWSVDGTKAGIIQPEDSFVVEDDITLYPIVNYDFNFAIKDSQRGWSYNIGGVTYEDNLAKTWHKAGSGNDGYFCYTGLNAPTVDVHKLVLWATVDYEQYPDIQHEQPVSKMTIKSGQSFEGLFFSHTGQGDNGSRRVSGIAQEFVTAPDGTQYVGIVCDPTTNGNWQKDGLFYKIRFDPNNIYGGLNYRYIELRDYAEYEDDVIDVTLTLPEVGKAPDLEAEVDEIATIVSITWSPELSAGGNFKALTAYSAELVISPADTKMRFADDATVVVSGFEAEITGVDAVTGTITATVEFPATVDYKPFDFDLSAVPAEIVVENVEDIQLTANITETTEGISEQIIWTIEEGDNAAITTDGVLSIYDAGTITVKAVSAYNENKAYTKDIVITLTDAVAATVITFSDENIAEAPAAITRLAGDIVDLRDYLGVKSAVEGMNFNGWTLDGETILTGEITVPDEDVTLTAVVNYDINMAVPNNTVGWVYRGTTYFENDMLIADNATNTNGDVYLQKLDGYKVPANDYGKLHIYFTAKCDVGGTEKVFKVGDSVEGIYFLRDADSGAAEERKVAPGKVIEVTDDGFAVAEFNMTLNQNWNTNIKGIRFDIGGGLYTYGVRYIRFVEKDVYEDTLIEIEDIIVPETGADVEYTATDAAGLVEVTNVAWSPEEFMAYNYDGTDYVKFDANKAYTAAITARIPLGANMKFAEGTTATVYGEEAALVENEDGTVTITYTFAETEPFVDFTMEITGPDTISKEGRTTQYRLIVDGDIPVKTASWAIAEGYEGYAIINETNGRLTPIRNIDELKIIATSHYNPAITAEFTVKLENQAADAVVYYDANTTDTVTNMPDPTAGAGTIKLSTQIPEREGYLFAGWSVSTDSRTVVNSVATDGADATVYAVWDKIAVSFEFNNSDDGFTSVQAGKATKHPEYLELVSSGNGDLRITHKGGITLDPTRTNRMVIRQSANVASTQLIAYFWVPGQKDILGNMEEGYTLISGGVNSSTTGSAAFTGLDDWQILELTFTDADWAASSNIPRIAYDPLNGAGYTAYIDYIRFLDDYRDITFVANAGEDVVEGMPENGIVKVAETLKIVEKPTRAGYEFLGWAKTADATVAATEFYVGDNMTLYAIWVKTVEVVDPTLVDLGAVTEEAVVVTTSPVSEVTVTVTTADGEQILTATADENGVAVIDLTEVEGEIIGATVTASTDITKVVVTDAETAESLITAAGAEETDGKTNILVNGVDKDGSTGDGKYPYDNTVETVKPSGPAYNPPKEFTTDGSEAEAGASGDIKADMASAGEILLNFDNKYEGDFFPTASLRQFTLNGISDSVISFTNKGKAAGSNDSPALFTTSFELDAATHPYIVMKIRNSSDSACRIYFRTAEAGFAEARAMTQSHGTDYTMVVYDMSTLADWKGTVTGMFFSMGATAGDIVEIDWIMFTDTLPESMDAIEGTKEIFPIVNKGTMPFEDVKDSDWFYSEVYSAYRLGFVEGISTSPSLYAPQGQVTVAEVITLAVRLNCSYNGTEAPTVAEGAEWYKNYVDYALKNSIIKSNQFADYNAPALRKEVAAIMYKALPNDYLESINMFTSIPDVSTKDSAYGAIRKLYNAGILMGMDEAYNFYPDNNVTRAEIAAVVNRMAIPANRKRIVTEAELEARRQYYYAEDLDIAALGNCYESKPTIKNGFATAMGKSGDPILYLTNVVGQLNGKEVTKITVALKWDTSKISAKPVLFFTTPSGGWAAGRMLSSKSEGTTENGSTIFTFDPKSNGQFADTITGLRFDPFDAKDIEFSVEYIIVE